MTHIARARAPTSCSDPLAHLGGRLVGEGDGQDLRRLGGPGAHQVGDPAGERARLARAGPGEDQQRPLAVGHGLALGLVQPLEQRFRGGRCAGSLSGRGHSSEDRPGGGGARLARLRPWASATRCGSRARRSLRTPARYRSTPRSSGRSSLARRRCSTPSATTWRARREDVAMYMLTLDSINFGSGWFPTLRKRPGCSGYFTVAWALADHFRSDGPWDAAGPAGADRGAGGGGPGPGARPRADEPLRPRAERPRRVHGRPRRAGRGGRGGRLGRAAGGAAGRGHALLRRSRLLQARADPAERPGAGRAWRGSATSTGSRSSPTTWCRTCCGSTVCCATTTRWRRRIDAGELLEPGREEREIRACAVHACELIAAELGVPPRMLDMWLWNRGPGAALQGASRGTARAPSSTDGATPRPGRCRRVRRSGRPPRPRAACR